MELIDQILSARNLTEACEEVTRNKGAGGVDRMSAKSLKPHLDENRGGLTADIHSGSYYPQPIRGKEIPKRNGRKRLLGIPTVVERMLHQATARVLQNKYDFMFSSYSYGFRPHRNDPSEVVIYYCEKLVKNNCEKLMIFFCYLPQHSPPDTVSEGQVQGYPAADKAVATSPPTARRQAYQEAERSSAGGRSVKKMSCGHF